MMNPIMDEYHGQGGYYILDAKTGKRQLIRRTEPAVLPALETDGQANQEEPDSGQG